MPTRTREEFLDHAGGDEEFAGWLIEVDELCLAKFGMGLFDLPDMLTRDAYDAEEDPADFFQETVVDVAAEEYGFLPILEERRS